MSETSELSFRRVVVLCDASSDIRLAVAEAAALAARWRAALHGVFLEDENLHRLAALPFTQQVSLSAIGISEGLSGDAMAGLVAALSGAMRRILAEAAAAQGLEWTFGSIRDLPAATTIEAAEGDVLVVEGSARAFSGAWRPRARTDMLPGGFTGPVLIRGQRTGGSGIVLVLPAAAAAWGRILAAGAALAGANADVTLMADRAALTDAKAAAMRYFAAESGRVKTVARPADPASARRALARLNPAVVVVEAGNADEPLLGEVLAAARFDVLLVR